MKIRAEQRIYRLARIAKDRAEPIKDVTSKIENGRSYEIFISAQLEDAKEAGKLLLERNSILDDFFKFAELRVPHAFSDDLRRSSEGQSPLNGKKILSYLLSTTKGVILCINSR